MTFQRGRYLDCNNGNTAGTHTEQPLHIDRRGNHVASED